MAQDPVISIVIPSYNQARFLESCLRSVLEQPYARKEIFVIDGGSTDGSVEILKSYSSRLAGWVSEPDRGQAHAVNKGWSMAGGDILGWLNSDDAYSPRIFPQLADAYRTHPRASLLFGDIREIDAQDRPLDSKSMAGFGLSALLLGKNMGQPGVFVTRRTYQTVGGLDESLHFALDFEYFLRVWTAFPADGVYLPMILASSRRWGETKTSSRTAQWGEEYSRVVEAYFRRTDLPAAVTGLRRRAIARCVLFRQARLFLISGDWRNGMAWMWRAIREEESPREKLRFCYAALLAWRGRDTFR